MTFSIKQVVAKPDQYKMFLKILSALMNLKLSDREINIIDGFYQESNGIISKESRKLVAEKLNITEFNLNNYLKQMRKKNVMKADTINPQLILSVVPANDPVILNLFLHEKE